MNKMSEPRVLAILTALEAGCTRRAASAAADIHHATFYRWMEQDATLRDAVEKAENVAEAHATVLIRKAAFEGNWTAAAWWLERRRSDDYAKRDRLEVKVDMTAEIRRMATELGLDEAALLAEAEAILAGAK